MIRRGFWLMTGAVLGVTGYRKASRIARTLTGGYPGGGQQTGARRALGGGRQSGAQGALAERPLAGAQLAGAQRVGAQQAGAEEGVTDAEKRARGVAGHSQPSPPPLARPAYPRVRPRPAARSGAERVAAAIGFVRDVRDGVAEYRDLHRGELDRNLESRGDALESRSDRARSGSPGDCREP